jgi:hypothetical protein
MQPPNLNDVVRFVEENIGGFHKRKADNLRKLKLEQEGWSSQMTDYV